ncbi:MAG: hypothetical protein RLZZ450_468 [Pseudomonadota bacterium]|jgi:uncharacterized protein YkwD
MTRSDRTTYLRAARATWRCDGLVALALVLGLGAGCASDPTTPTDEQVDPAEEDDSDGPITKWDSGAGKDAGRKDAGSDTADAGKPTSSKDAGGGATGTDAGKPRDAGGTTTVDAGQTPVTPVVEGDTCGRWKAARVSLDEGKWTGNAEACEAGDMSEDARTNALRLFNYYRTSVGLAAVTTTPEGNRLAQNCALLMRANNTITHTPPDTFKCFTAEAAKTAGSSSLSSGPAVASVDGYMIDPGNPTTIGHRRWILSNMITEVGFGSADRFSCQYQPAKFRNPGGKAWVAWPSGQTPKQSLGGGFSGSVDKNGWTVQSDTVNLASATVTVTSDGKDMPVTVTQLGGGYGSMYALRFNPTGWTSTAGVTYSVKLGGTSMPIEYDVTVVDCP